MAIIYSYLPQGEILERSKMWGLMATTGRRRSILTSSRATRIASSSSPAL